MAGPGRRAWPRKGPGRLTNRTFEVASSTPFSSQVTDLPARPQRNSTLCNWIVTSLVLTVATHLPCTTTEWSTSGFKQPGQSWVSIPPPVTVVSLPAGKQEWQQPAAGSKNQPSWVSFNPLSTTPFIPIGLSNPCKPPSVGSTWTNPSPLVAIVPIPDGKQEWQQPKTRLKDQPTWVTIPPPLVVADTYLPCLATEWTTSGFKQPGQSWISIPVPVAAVSLPDGKQEWQQPAAGPKNQPSWAAISPLVAIVPIPDGKQEWQQPKAGSKYQPSWEGISPLLAIVPIPDGKQEWQQPKAGSKYQPSWEGIPQPVAVASLPSGSQEWQQPKTRLKDQPTWVTIPPPLVVADTYLPCTATETSTSGFKKPGQSFTSSPPPAVATAIPDGKQEWQSPQHSLRTKTGQTWINLITPDQYIFREPLIASRKAVKYNQDINSWVGIPPPGVAAADTYLPCTATEWTTSGFKQPGQSWSNLLPPAPTVSLPSGKQDCQQPKSGPTNQPSWTDIPPPVVGAATPLPDGKQEWQQTKVGLPQTGLTYTSNTSALLIPANVKPQPTNYDWPLPVQRIYPKGLNTFTSYNPNLQPPTPPPPATDDHYLPFFSTVGKMKSF